MKMHHTVLEACENISKIQDAQTAWFSENSIEVEF